MRRREVDVKETWDLSKLFETEEDYKKSLEDYKTKVESFVSNYKGKINSLEMVNSSIKDLMEIYELGTIIGDYAYLAVEADAFDDQANDRINTLLSVLSVYDSKLSFYKNELLELDTEVLEKAKQIEDNKTYVEDILLDKKYSLDTNVEEVLSKLEPTLSFPYNLYNTTKIKDMDFPTFEVNGKKYELSYNLYEDGLDGNDNADVRRKAFKEFSKVLSKYQNTTAAAYNAQVQKEKTLSDIRGHKSVFDYLLKDHKVTNEMYNRQMDIIMDELAPHMRKYANILKKVHKLDSIKYSDLKVDVDPNYSPSVSFEKAREYVLDGLSVLGEDYIQIIKEAFDNRWIDYAKNEGKATGAFCATPYKKDAYILINFNESMSDVMTLAHELGHAAHFTLAHKNQSIFNSECSMYFVESPSTTNELIVENYLLDLAEKDNDLKMKRWVLSQMVAKTYYHNFVTHLLEAYYQREVYKLVESGQHVYANTLNNIYKETLEKFWGDSVELEEGSELTWMRQPHYYMGLYSYTYSAGLTIGTQVAKSIRKEGIEAANRWKEVLKMGGTKTPLELAKSVGVNISTDRPLKDTVAYIGSLIDEIEAISVELGEM